MMPKYSLTWETTDVQLLEALLLATSGEGGVPLQEVLLMADAIDGTVFSLDEVTQGLLKLTAVGYVIIRKNKLMPSQEVSDFAESIAGAASEQEELSNLLQAKELTTANMLEAEAELKKYKLKSYYQQYTEQYG
ncbi:hypothetical protein ACSX1A_20540 [Pontibacter sp. MBLB2868]|uniref:hypothetical protein n=1 Tax=Pontibacter sp. MBLB2868 TaxID=3451555 RepID=UPI003F7518F8